jgi:hypothetical protein
VFRVPRGMGRVVSVGRCSPAGQQVQGVLSGGSGLGGVGEEALTGVGGQREGLEGEVEVADDRVGRSLMPLVWMRTLCAAQRRRNSSPGMPI